MPTLEEILKRPLFANAPLDLLIAIGIVVGSFVLLLLLRRLVRRYHDKLQATPQVELLEIPLQVLSKTTLPLFIALSLFLGLGTVAIAPRSSRVLESLLTIALFWQVGIWAVAAVSAWLNNKRRRSLVENRGAVGSLGIIGFIVNVVIWTLVVLLTLANLGINITALVAGLGIGGVAVALAVQNILGDLFASLSITLDRPFVVGDFLNAGGEFLGTVESIGIKSTRLRSLSGEQIVVPNADLLGSRVRNFGRMTERRVVFITSITYETPIESVERVPALIRSIVESQPLTRFDRSHFARHAAASLDFETVYFVLSPDYARYMDIQQAINLQLHRELAQLKISFAYPTQRLLMEPVMQDKAA